MSPIRIPRLTLRSTIRRLRSIKIVRLRRPGAAGRCLPSAYGAVEWTSRQTRTCARQRAVPPWCGLRGARTTRKGSPRPSCRTLRTLVKTAFGAQCSFWACTARAWTRQHPVWAPDNSAFALSELTTIELVLYSMAVIHTMDHALCVTVQLAASRTPSWGCFKKSTYSRYG
jgi:hypothetical protein